MERSAVLATCAAGRWGRRLPLLAAFCLLALLPRAAPLRAQTAGPLVAVACSSDGSPIAFPRDGGDPPLLQPATLPNAVLDTGDPPRAVTCQAVVEDPAAADPFAPDAGVVTVTVGGPAEIAENGAAGATVECGCDAAIDGASVTAPADLIFHVVQQPGAPLPSGAAPGAVTVTVAFQSAEGGTALATAAIDLLPPTVTLNLSAQPVLDLSGSYSTVLLTVQIAHFVPAGCSAIGDGPFISCATPISATQEPGAEPGTVTFTTSLGTFADGAQQMQLACGQPPTGAPTVPYPGLEQYGGSGCATLSASIALQGHVGDATFSAGFSGAYTGALATATATLTIAPLPPSYRLVPGCTQVSAPLELPPNAPVSLIAESVTPPDIVTGVWRQGADGGWQLGYAPGADAPLDFDTVMPGDTLFVCVNGLGAYPLH